MCGGLGKPVRCLCGWIWKNTQKWQIIRFWPKLSFSANHTVHTLSDNTYIFSTLKGHSGPNLKYNHQYICCKHAYSCLTVMMGSVARFPCFNTGKTPPESVSWSWMQNLKNYNGYGWYFSVRGMREMCWIQCKKQTELLFSIFFSKRPSKSTFTFFTAFIVLQFEVLVAHS